MGVSFFEVMNGELLDSGGTPHPIRFQIKGESTDLPHFLLTGQAKITGVVDAPPFAEAAPLDGEMGISFFRRREIAYRFSFTDPEGRPCQFKGRKDLSVFRPITSMTLLDGVLERDGEEIARGELRFDLSDLPEFCTSWWPSTSIPRAPMHTPLGGLGHGEPLTETEKNTLKALAEATFSASTHVPLADDETLQETIHQLQTMPAHVFSLQRVGLRWLDRITLASDRRRFSELPLARRKELLQQWTAEEPNTLGARLGAGFLVQVLTLLLKTVHFGRQDYLDSIGHPRPKQQSPEKPERYMQRVVAAEDLDEETTIHAHVVVVGTGAGGAAVAYQLAKQGLAVAIVEEGRYHQRHDFTGPPVSRIDAMYRYKSTNLSIGTPVLIPQGRAVGGTTTINSGTCFATPDSVLDEWRRDLGFPKDFEPEHFNTYSDQVAAMLQVAPGDPAALGRIADVIARGADKLGLDHGPLPRNAPGCPGAGECILGCPEGAKRSTDVSYIPAALKAGAELYVGLRATRVLMNDRRAVAVEARGADRFGRPRTLRIHADRIVLATGAVQSPVFLRENGFRLPMIGENLSLHPALGVVARMNEDLTPWKTIPQGYAIHALQSDDIRFEGYYLHPQLLASQLPFVGDELSRWMDDFPKLAQFGFMVRDRGTGSVRRGPDGLPLVSYRLSKESIAKLQKGSALLAHLFLEAGASEVFVGFGPTPIVRTPEQAHALEHHTVGPLSFRLLGAHPLGTCRMGKDQSLGVVDFDHRLFGTDNLYVVDGSTVPTSLGVNPQMTIMAMALRAGDKIAAHSS